MEKETILVLFGLLCIVLTLLLMFWAYMKAASKNQQSHAGHTPASEPHAPAPPAAAPAAGHGAAHGHGGHGHTATLSEKEMLLYVALATVGALLIRWHYGWSDLGAQGDALTVGSGIVIYGGLKIDSTWGLKIAVAIGGAVVIFFLAGGNFQTAKESFIDWLSNGSSPTNASQPAPTVTEGEAQWDKTAKDGSLPVNEWSAWTKLGQKCSIDLVYKPGVYRIQYLFYSKEPVEYVYVPGVSPSMSEFRYMVLVPGITSAPYTVTCP